MKKLFLILAAGPALAFSQPVFDCVTTASGSKHHLSMKLNGAVPLTGKASVRALGELSDTKESNKFCSVFTVEKKFQRLGYVVSYEGVLPNGTLVKLNERSFTNEGPASFSNGHLVFRHGKPDAEKVALDCSKP